MNAALPLADPQFWIVTGLVALVALIATRRIVRSLRDDASTPCANCPRVAAAPDGAKSRLRVVPLLALALLPAVARAASIERTVAAMGTTLRVEVEIATDRAAALAVAEAMIREVEATEEQLSTWRDNSELSALNRSPVGRWMAVSASLYGAIRSSQQCAFETGGAFDPSLAALAEAWGLRTGGRIPSASELAIARAQTGWRAIEFRVEPWRLRRAREVRIDEGGFGKGLALDRAAAVARAQAAASAPARFELNLGGQISWQGEPTERWVRIAHPRDRARPVLELELVEGSGSIASSGNSERGAVRGERRIGHLLDPRTGAPAADFGSVTVLSESGFGADCLSTGLFVLGPEAGLKLAATLPRKVEALFLVVEGDRLIARVTPGLEKRIRRLDERVRVEQFNQNS